MMIGRAEIACPLFLRERIGADLIDARLDGREDKFVAELPMRYDFLVETYETERVKVVSVWSEFRDEDLAVRPRADDRRGRSVRVQMVHQRGSEDFWFRTILGLQWGDPALPAQDM